MTLYSPVSTVTDPWGLEDLKKDQEYDSLTPGDVYCYENCMSVIGSSVAGLQIEDLAALNWRKCPKLLIQDLFTIAIYVRLMTNIPR